MKKILSVLCALMMLVMPVLGCAENAVSYTTVDHYNREGIEAMYGDNAAMVTDMWDAMENITQTLTITDKSIDGSYTLNNGETVTFVAKLEGLTVYLDSSMLKSPLKLDLAELLHNLTGMVVSGAEASLTDAMNFDLFGLIADLSSCQMSTENTVAAVISLAFTSMSTDESGNMIITVTADGLCSVLDALGEDLKASTGVDEMAAKYVGAENVTDQLLAMIDSLKELITGSLSGDIVVCYGEVIGVTLPLTDAAGNPDVYSFSFGNNTLTLAHNDEVYAVSYAQYENGYGIAVTANGEEVFSASLTVDDNVTTLIMNYMGIELVANVVVGENTYASTLKLNGVTVMTANVTVTENYVSAVFTSGSDNLAIDYAKSDDGMTLTVSGNGIGLFSCAYETSGNTTKLAYSYAGHEVVYVYTQAAENEVDAVMTYDGIVVTEGAMITTCYEDYTIPAIDEAAAVDVLTLDAEALCDLIVMPDFLFATETDLNV